MNTIPFHSNNFIARVLFAVLVLLLLLSFGTKPALGDENNEGVGGECIELADIPLEIKSRGAPPLINLVLDNTRSMYWTIMTGEDDGTFFTTDGRDYQLVFPEPTFAGADVLPYEDRAYWKTQWSGHNTMYYNPDVDYAPWPKWDEIADNWTGGKNADPDNPRMHPMVDDTLNLNGPFYTLGQEGTGDVLSYGDIFFPDGGDDWNHRNPSIGNHGNYISHDNHFYSTGTENARAEWTFEDLEGNDRYDVYVFVPYYENEDDPEGVYDAGYTTGVAEYVVTDGNQTVERTLDEQSDYQGWTEIATNVRAHNQNDNLVVELKNISGTVSANAVQIVYAGSDVAEGDPDAVSMIYAHYYVKGDDDEIYMINLDGEISYYHFVDANNNNKVDEGELRLLDDDLDADREKINVAGIRTGRTYEQERQNFANWYQFYRKRSFTGIGGVSQFIDNLTGAYFRLSGFPPAAFNFQLEPIRVTIDGNYYDETVTVLENLYNLKSPQAVSNNSLVTSLDRVGSFFEDGSFSAGHSLPYAGDEYPFFLPEYGGECQQAFAILMTGGFWRVGPSDDTLAETAEYYWETDLAPTLDDLVPTNPMDEANWQHLVTYGISFGVHGENDPDRWQNCNLEGGFDCPDWPDPQSFHKSTIDDLWHATVVGRGLFFNADNPQELTASLLSILSDIERRVGTATSVSANSSRRRTGTHLYQSRFNSINWSGDLVAFPIRLSDGRPMGQIWSAQEELDAISDQNIGDRKIYTFDGSGGHKFKHNRFNGAQSELLTEDQVDYLRGYRGGELQNGGPFRNRDSRLGDIVHSQPVYHKGVVYVGANDGMLHAFDAADGKEIMAYVPNLVFENLAALTNPSYTHQYYVNNTPFVRNIGERDLLVGGLGKGGKGYYCLDVTKNSQGETGSFAPDLDVWWEYSANAENDDDLGYSYSRAVIAKTEAEGWVVIFGNGYNSVNGEAILYVLDADTGDVLRKIKTGVAGCNGIPADVTAIDKTRDGNTDFVYAGDLKGNLWKFDLRGSIRSDWGIAYNGNPLFTARNSDDEIQPITARVSVIQSCMRGLGGNMVLFGTGRYVNEGDLEDYTIQSLYGIWDWQEVWEIIEGNDNAGDDKHFGTFQAGAGTLSNLTGNLGDLTLLRQEVTDEPIHEGNEYIFMTDNEINYYNPDIEEGEHVGWVYDFTDMGERGIEDLTFLRDVVLAIGTVPTPALCQAGGSSVFYALDFCSGGAMGEPVFDINDDRRVDHNDVIEPYGFPSGIKYETIIYRPALIRNTGYITGTDMIPPNGNGNGESNGNGNGENDGDGNGNEESDVGIDTIYFFDGALIEYWHEINFRKPAN